MGSYGDAGSEWVAVDTATVGDATRRRHPTGQGAYRIIGQALEGSNLGAYTISNRRITLSGFFQGYAAAAGDTFFVTAGTGFAVGTEYTISSSANNFIVLSVQANLPTANNTNTTGYIIPAGSILGRAKACRVPRLVVTASDVLDETIEFRSQIDSSLIYSLPVVANVSVPYPVPLNLNLPGGFTIGPPLGGSATTLAWTAFFERVQ